jgi:hypothetical protein
MKCCLIFTILSQGHNLANSDSIVKPRLKLNELDFFFFFFVRTD